MPLLLLHQTHPVTALTPKPTVSFIYNQQKEVISSIHITRHLIFLYIELQCTPFNVTNIHTKRSVKVETKQLISPFQARRIHNILRRPYTAYFILSNHRYFKILE